MHADMVARGVLVWELTGSSAAVGGVLGATLLYALSLARFAAAAEIIWLYLAFPLMMMVGISQTAFRAMNTTILMETTPEPMRGRVIATTLLATGLMPVAALAAGFTADRYGVSAGYALLSAGCLAVVGLVLVIYPKVRTL